MENNSFVGHRCKSQQQFRSLEMEDGCEQEIEAKTTEEVGEQDSPEKPDDNQGLLRLSLHYMVGLTTEMSMRMKGKIADTNVIVLIDSGATRNFISLEIVRTIGLPVTETRGFGGISG